MQGNAVHRGGHGVFADPVMHIVARKVIGRNGHGRFGVRQIGRGQVRRSAQQFGNGGNQNFQSHLGSFARGDFGLVGQQLFFVRLHFFFPARGQDMIDDGAFKFGFFRSVHAGEAFFPGFAFRLSFFAESAPFV